MTDAPDYPDDEAEYSDWIDYYTRENHDSPVTDNELARMLVSSPAQVGDELTFRTAVGEEYGGGQRIDPRDALAYSTNDPAKADPHERAEWRAAADVITQDLNARWRELHAYDGVPYAVGEAAERINDGEHPCHFLATGGDDWTKLAAAGCPLYYHDPSGYAVQFGVNSTAAIVKPSQLEEISTVAQHVHEMQLFGEVRTLGLAPVGLYRTIARAVAQVDNTGQDDPYTGRLYHAVETALERNLDGVTYHQEGDDE